MRACKNTTEPLKLNKAAEFISNFTARMNYLAHAYLSFHHPDILVGNMISDFIKGKKQYTYPIPIQYGLRLHRAIDTFTDQHPATREAKAYLQPAVGAYAGALIDVVYDHFLALDETELTEVALKIFAVEVYRQLQKQEEILPEKFALMLPYMIDQNWLYHYRFTDGVEKSFGGVARRALYLTGIEEAYQKFLLHYSKLRDCYQVFFPDVKKFAHMQLAEFLNT